MGGLEVRSCHTTLLYWALIEGFRSEMLADLGGWRIARFQVLASIAGGVVLGAERSAPDAERG